MVFFVGGLVIGFGAGGAGFIGFATGGWVVGGLVLGPGGGAGFTGFVTGGRVVGGGGGFTGFVTGGLVLGGGFTGFVTGGLVPGFTSGPGFATGGFTKSFLNVGTSTFGNLLFTEGAVGYLFIKFCDPCFNVSGLE